MLLLGVWGVLGYWRLGWGVVIVMVIFKGFGMFVRGSGLGYYTPVV